MNHSESAGALQALVHYDDASDMSDDEDGKKTATPPNTTTNVSEPQTDLPKTLIPPNNFTAANLSMLNTTSFDDDLQDTPITPSAQITKVATPERSSPDAIFEMLSKPEDIDPELLARYNLPPAPPGRCDIVLLDRLQPMFLAKAQGYQYPSISAIEATHEFRNPSIYEKLIEKFGIDERGTNFSQDVFDPHYWTSDSHYLKLRKAQQDELAKAESQKRKHDVEKVSKSIHDKLVSLNNPSPSNLVKGSGASSLLSVNVAKRQSKWDSVPALSSVPGKPVVQKLHGMKRPTPDK